MLVVSRFRVPVAEGESFRGELQAALDALAERPGHVGGTIGRNVDDPELWVLSTRWDNVGSYRRALSAYDVKLRAVRDLGLNPSEDLLRLRLTRRVDAVTLGLLGSRPGAEDLDVVTLRSLIKED